MRTGQRDQVGFEEFVVARGAALQRAAWLLTGDEHLAQDLVQTALADAWMRWPRVARHGGDVEVYVRRCLYTTYVNWWRRRSWSERPMDISGTGEGKRGAEHSDSACEASDRVDVVSALRMLSPQQRAVVVLRYLDDLSIEQTASALGMSTSAATTHQARALARLRTSHLLLSNEEMTP